MPFLAINAFPSSVWTSLPLCLFLLSSLLKGSCKIKTFQNIIQKLYYSSYFTYIPLSFTVHLQGHVQAANVPLRAQSSNCLVLVFGIQSVYFYLFLYIRGMFEMNCLILSGDFKFQVSPKVLISCPRSTPRG